MEKTKVTKDLEANTLTIERVFDAPKSKVWHAFSEKEWFTAWWGPEGWETTVKEFEFKTGGRNHYCMKCVDENQGEWFGQESWGLMEYGHIDEPSRLTYKDYFSNAEGTIQENMPGLEIEVELVEVDGKTNLITRCIAKSNEDIEKLLSMGMVEGFSSSGNKLERLLLEA